MMSVGIIQKKFKDKYKDFLKEMSWKKSYLAKKFISQINT